MNSKIRKLMNKRYKALIKTQVFRDSADWSVYGRLRNDVTKESISISIILHEILSLIH